jgi:hypothetical protein
LAGADVLILEEHSFGKVDIVGVGDNLIKDVPLCTAAGLIQTTIGPIIAIMHNYAALGTGGSIHSPVQLREHGIMIDDTPKTQKRFDGEFGEQLVRIPTAEEDKFDDIELKICGGLAYFDMVPPTPAQLNDPLIPHVRLTSDMQWDPSKFDDSEMDSNTTVFEPMGVNQAYNLVAYDCDVFLRELEVLQAFQRDDDFYNDEFLELQSDESSTDSTIIQSNSSFEVPFVTIPNVVEAVASVCRTVEAKLTHIEHKYGKTIEQLRPNFAWASTERIKATLEASTQFYRATQWSKKIKRHFKSRFPGANVVRVNETVCTDTAFMETTACADGITGHGGAIGFQLFVGADTRHLAVYPVKTDGDYPQVLEDYIRTHGAPKKIFSDNAKAQQSVKAKAVYRNFGITDGSSDPHYQNQNSAEREIQDVKKDVEAVLNITNTPYKWWPLCVENICLVKNHTARTSLGDRTPMEKRTGQTPDVSKLLQYRWWEPVYFLNEKGTEVLGRWAGIAEHVGDELTFVVISDATGHAMYRSDLRTTADPNAPNFRAESVAADALNAKNKHGLSSGVKDPGSTSVFLPIGQEAPSDSDEKVYPFTPEDLIGKIFMRKDPANGDIVRSKIVRMLKKEAEATTQRVKFLVETKNGTQTAEEVMDYVELCYIVEAQVRAIEDGTNDGLLTFKSILAHQGPLSVKNPLYKGSAWNILVEWDAGEPTWEPLNLELESNTDMSDN